MKIKSSQIFQLIFVLLIYWIPNVAQSQDSIKVEDLKAFSSTFDINDGALIGPGAEVLRQAVANAHVVMLGNNSRNQLESDLDLALSKVLNKNDFNTLIMETGPSCANIVDRLSSQQSKSVTAFKKLNQKYYFEAGGLLFMPIPDLKYEGTAKFTTYLKEQGWSIGGLGPDSWTSYKLLIDELYQNLSIENKQVYQKDYKASITLLDNLYTAMKGQSYDDLLGLISGIQSSLEFNKFLDDMDSIDGNTKLVTDLRYSIGYWGMYGNKKFHDKNELNARHAKQQMKAALDEFEFDFSKDKVLLKMWRGHLTNGVTPNGFYGVGNMMMELANYHGHNSLNIGILGRYTIEDGVLKDVLDKRDQVLTKHQPFIALGEKDKWVLVDLRPFNKTFHWGNYIQTLDMQNMMRRYDMIIIPKTDRKAKVNS